MKVHQFLRTCNTTVHGSGVAQTKLHNLNIAHFYGITYISVSAYILYRYITLHYVTHAHAHAHTHTYIHTYIYIHIHTYIFQVLHFLYLSQYGTEKSP